MEIGFEFTAAKPKGLRAAGDEPVQQPMRPREVTVNKNPSAEQRRVRRQMARQQHTAAEKGDLFRHEPHPCPVCRKPCPFVSDHGDVLVYNCPMHGTFDVPRRAGSRAIGAESSLNQGESMDRVAAMNDVGDCRLCGGDLKHAGSDDAGIVAKCQDCGTTHHLQGQPDEGGKRVGHIAQQAAEFTDRDWAHLAALEVLSVNWEEMDTAKCPKCGNAGEGQMFFRGAGKSGTLLECRKCKERFHAKSEHHKHHGSKFDLLRFASLRWVPQYDASRYASPTLSAIARRAHAVLDSSEGTP